MSQRKTIRIGVIADTHGLFDIGDRSVIEQLRQIAPITAVSGNVDDTRQSEFPSEAVIDLAGRRIALHSVRRWEDDKRRAGVLGA